MSKEPLLNRAELRKQRGEHINRLGDTPSKPLREQPRMEAAESPETQPMNNPYRKTLKKEQPIRKTRTSERQRSRQMNNFLMKSIVIVALLIVVVALMIWFL